MPTDTLDHALARRLRLGLGLLGLALLAGSVAAKDAPAFKVIAHPALAGNAIRRALLADIFLKNVRHWGDGTPVTPVDQSTRWRLRASFSLNVLSLPVSSVQTYWQRQAVMNRERPPLVLGSDEEVLAFVAATPGAIGYVSPDAATNEAVRILTIVD